MSKSNATEQYESAPKELLLAQKIANISDAAVTIPFTRFQVGADFLIGLIPGVGDLIMFGVGSSIIVLAKKMRMPKRLIFKMLLNSAKDFLLGLIPLLGDFIDMFYKSNIANVRIMEKWWLEQHHAEITQNTKQQLEQWQQENP